MASMAGGSVAMVVFGRIYIAPELSEFGFLCTKSNIHKREIYICASLCVYIFVVDMDAFLRI